MAGGTIPVINATADKTIPYEDLATGPAAGGQPGGGPFAVVVADDSMEPALCEGDYVIFTPVDVPGAAAVLEDGAVVFACLCEQLEAGACTLARYYPLSEGIVLLRKDNPRYQPLTVNRGMIKRLAVAIERRTRLI